ncbi:hypothetical protein FRC04_005098 [Tulasnella sp. 424]|nr:hypothetical protein FRC04_005098 [Tulasnella sp. 424]KAG8970373.1 hypothetical protein FRC05_000619 [Tulasnella sp. 425]
MWRAFASTVLCLAALGSKVLAQTYEAEAGVLTGVTVDTTATGFTGAGYVTGFDDASDQVAISINTTTYGVYTLSIRYRAPNGDKKAALLLDGTGAGEVSLTSSTSFTSVTAGKLLLAVGSHTLTIQSDWGWYDIDSVTLAPAPLPPATGTFEAEDGILTGNTYIDSTSATGFSGTGFVTGFQAASDSVAILVNAPSYAVYSLTVRYRAPYGDKKTALVVNGTPSGEVDLASTNDFTSVAAGKVLLNQGSNIIAFQNDWGWYNIDAISIAVAPAPPPHKANKLPVDKLATWEARSLLKYVQKKYGKKILSGQQELEYIDWLKTNVGKKPAICGLDLIDYSPSRVAYNATSHAVEDAFAWDKLGGITTFVWHWNAPTDLIDVPGQEWWRGFYTSATTFDVAAALANKNGTDYKLILRDLDAIAVQLKRLQRKNIPILWRPLHESVAAGWFWWSAKGPDATIELYRLMFKRFTQYHQIHNLIWVWSSPEPAFYPGDDYVDIIGYDSYPALGDHGPVSATYDAEIAIVQDKKPVTLSEVGSIPDPDLLQVYHADWSYFVVWGGEFINDDSHNPISFLKKVYNSTYVVTLGEVGNFKYLL